MGILNGFLQQVRTWDTPTRLSFAIALGLFVIAILLLTLGPDETRNYALAGVVGLVLAMQFIVLWGNRHMITPYTQAQRYYIAGKFSAARDVLESHLGELAEQGKKPSSDVLTLLGNIYRQLGNLTKSEQLLRDALKIDPKSHFSHYGFGRTLLAKGAFADAAHHFKTALALQAPPIVVFDLGHAYIRLGEVEAAQSALNRAIQHTDEVHRLLMATYWLYQMDSGDRPDANLIVNGLPLWQQDADRFADTLYGQHLKNDIDALIIMS